MIEGRGRAIGAVLIEADRPPEEAFSISFTRWTFCGAPRCKGKTSITNVTPMRARDEHAGKERWLLPPGTYRLYLITDGAPVKVTLELDGLGGSASLRPKTQARIEHREPAWDPHVTDGAAFARDSIQLESEGLRLQGVRMKNKLGAGSRGTYYWRDETISGSNGGHSYGYNTTGQKQGYAIIFSARMPPGSWNMLHWQAWAGDTELPDVLDLWVELD